MVSHNKDSTKSILGETLVWKSFIKILKWDVAIAGHVEKSRWRPLTSLQKLAPILGSSQHDFGGKKNQKVGMMKLGMTHLRILFFLHDHALEKTPSSNTTTCWQQTIIWVMLQICQHLVNYVHHWVLLKPQDLPGYKMTGNWLPSTMPEPRGRQIQSPKVDEMMSYWVT